jgi:DNA polymerase-3 subunit epsilon
VSCDCFPTGRHYAGIAHLLRLRVHGTLSDRDASAAWLEMPIVMIDTETTGRTPETNRVVEVALVCGIRGELTEVASWLVNPEIPIPEDSSAVHGIRDADVANAPRFAEIAPLILQHLHGALPAAYNAQFDRAFLLAEFARAGFDVSSLPECFRATVDWIDPLVWARELQREDGSKRLSEVASRLGVELENAHRATADAEAALRIMYVFAKDSRVPASYGAMIQEQRRLADLQEQQFKLWRRK